LKVINVYVNGAPRQLADSCSVAMLVEELGYTARRIALERNGEIVPRSLYAAQLIADGDRLEIVAAVGGG
jgi:sulfur carrier protein